MFAFHPVLTGRKRGDDERPEIRNELPSFSKNRTFEIGVFRHVKTRKKTVDNRGALEYNKRAFRERFSPRARSLKTIQKRKNAESFPSRGMVQRKTVNSK